MKKLALLLALSVMLLTFTCPAIAADDLPAIEMVPTVNTVQGNVIWLMKEAAIAEGPAYDLLKLFNLVSIQVQVATINKEDAGTFIGPSATVKVVDVVKKLGGDPSDMLLTFNPGIGATFGYKTEGHSLDGGVVVNVVNLDLDKVAQWLGL